MTAPELERLARLEIQVDDMKRKVDEMHAAFLAAKGAKWLAIALWMGLGAFVVNVKWLLTAIGVKFG